MKELNLVKRINLLQARTFTTYNRDPDLLFKELSQLQIPAENEKQLVWIDEIQKIPALLDVVHDSIENFKQIDFIITGSSARKLRRGAANLLGGRALDLRLYPLSVEELEGDFNWNLYLRFGSLPRIYTEALKDQTLACDLLDAYVSTYIQDEIRNEALVKSLDAFQRFLEVAAAQFAEQINFAKIADDCLASSTAVTNYYSILEDTLIGSFLTPFASSVRKEFSQQPKFYFFDNGVTRAIQGLSRSEYTNLEKGKLFEQAVFNELKKINDYYRKNLKFYLWRTSTGVEVDFVVMRNREILLAIECKATAHPTERDLAGLKIFKRSNPKVPVVLCCLVETDQLIKEDYPAVSLQSLLEKVKDSM